MLEIPGRMQVTLVSHYGEKPEELSGLIHYCQRLLSRSLGNGFRPYQLEQVHGTIIGLEGHQVAGTIVNRNSADLGSPTHVDPAALLSFLRNDFPRIEVHIGGFVPWVDHGFVSRGEHPYSRSFSIQGKIAVAMGWPVRDKTFSKAIDDLRWDSCRRLGVRHKWHKHDKAEDNDFFFVLGRVEASLDQFKLRHAEHEVRTFLCGLEGVPVHISPDTLKIVAYVDEQLPPETSCALPLNDPGLNPARLVAFYPPPP
jgi:hypothetical protein